MSTTLHAMLESCDYTHMEMAGGGKRSLDTAPGANRVIETLADIGLQYCGTCYSLQWPQTVERAQH